MSNLEKQMQHRDKEMVPTFLVKAMFGLMIVTVGIVAYAQWADVPDRGVFVPIQVVRRENENIAILDDQTGMAVELIGYGKDNVAAFAQLLEN